MEYRQSDDQEWLENRLAFEERPENHIVVDAQPSRWHTALIPTRDHLISAVKKYDKMTKERLASEERRSKMKHPGLNADAIRWIDFDSGGLRFALTQIVHLLVAGYFARANLSVMIVFSRKTESLNAH